MGSVLGVAVFGSITASVFAGRMGGVSLAAAAAAGQRPGEAAVLHAAADAFVSGADRAVLAGAIVVTVGLVVAFRAFRPERTAVPVALVPAALVPAALVPAAPVPALVAEGVEVPVLEAVRN
jgi:hypothetical protein